MSELTRLQVIADIEAAMDTLHNSGVQRLDFKWGSVYMVGEMIRVDIKEIPEYSA